VRAGSGRIPCQHMGNLQPEQPGHGHDAGSGGLTYNAAGGVVNDGVNQYLYDGEGRICAVANGLALTGYIYDAEGQRVSKGTISSWSCDPGVNGFHATNDYILGLSGEQVTEMAVAGNTMAWQHTNVYAAGTLLATYDSNGLHFYLNDPLGTRRAQTDYAGVLEQTCSSLPFGDGLNCTNSTEYPTEHHSPAKKEMPNQETTTSVPDIMPAAWAASCPQTSLWLAIRARQALHT
jgi:YD repeat-containing protein